MRLTFRPLGRDDFALVASWLARPYVNKWWRDPAPTVEAIEAEYGANVDGDTTTHVYIVQADGHDIGLIQCFLLADYPENEGVFPLEGAASIDYFIGEEAFVGRGIGSAMIAQFVDEVVRPLYPDATGVATSAEVDNAPSLGALRKAGFEPGDVITGDYGTPERVMVRRF